MRSPSKRVKNPALRVLFVTVDVDLPPKLAGFQGVYAIHHKPIDADVLLAQLRELLKP